MNTARTLLIAILLGMLVAGPVVALAFFTVQLALDLVDPRVFAGAGGLPTFLAMTARRGVSEGFIAGLVCAAAACRRRTSAWAAGVVALVWTGLPTLSYMVRDGLGLSRYWRHACGPIIAGLGTAVTAYLIASCVPQLVRAWAAWSAGGKARPPTRRPPGHRYKL